MWQRFDPKLQMQTLQTAFYTRQLDNQHDRSSMIQGFKVLYCPGSTRIHRRWHEISARVLVLSQKNKTRDIAKKYKQYNTIIGLCAKTVLWGRCLFGLTASGKSKNSRLNCNIFLWSSCSLFRNHIDMGRCMLESVVIIENLSFFMFIYYSFRLIRHHPELTQWTMANLVFWDKSRFF